MQTESKLAYFAGLFDGEGTVEARLDKRTPKWMTLKLAVAMTNFEVIYWIQTNMFVPDEFIPQREKIIGTIKELNRKQNSQWVTRKNWRP